MRLQVLSAATVVRNGLSLRKSKQSHGCSDPVQQENNEPFTGSSKGWESNPRFADYTTEIETGLSAKHLIHLQITDLRFVVSSNTFRTT